jgi:ankyrin repeat protein
MRVYIVALGLGAVLSTQYQVTHAHSKGKRLGKLLLQAVKANELGEIRRLLGEQASAYHVDREGYPVLHWAPSAQAAELLLDQGADLHERDTEGATALHWAPHAGVARILLARGAQANARDNYARTPLHYALTARLAQELVNHSALIDARDNAHRTPLHYARSAAIVQALVRAGAHVRAQDQQGNTALDTAITMDVFRALLEVDPALVHVRDYNGQTIFARFVRNEHIENWEEALLALLQYNARVNVRNSAEQRAVRQVIGDDLIRACILGETHRVAQFLRNQPASIRDRVNRTVHGLTPLRAAVAQGHEQIVRYLLEQGAYVTHEDLQIAQAQGFERTAAFLRRYLAQGDRAIVGQNANPQALITAYPLIIGLGMGPGMLFPQGRSSSYLSQ